jgi:hypothetical protein
MTGGGTTGDVTLNVIGTADAITVSADAVTIASTYVGQTSITTLGTVATGTWQATDVGVAYGGTGASTLTDGGVLLGSGTGAVTALAALADGAIVIGDGTGDPTTLDVGSSTAITVLGTVATGTWQATDVGVAHGGTGVSSLTANSLLLGAGTSAVTFAAPGTSGNVLTSNGTVWASATPGTATSLDTGTVAYAGRTITVDTGGVLNIVLASAGGDDFTVDTDKLVIEGDSGLVTVGNNLTVTEDIVVTGAGPHAIGGPTIGYVGTIFGGAFTSSGASTTASGILTNQLVVGAGGDTGSIVGSRFASALRTQTATESIAHIAQVHIEDPQIDDNLTGDITIAASLYIKNAPTEGETNAALYVAAGTTYLGDDVGIGVTPSVRLHVKDTSTTDVVTIHGDATSGVISRIQHDNHIWRAPWLRANGDLRFYNETDGRYTLTLTEAGLVGIGTASPDSLLDLESAADAPTLTIQSTVATGGGVKTGGILSIEQHGGTGEPSQTNDTPGVIAFVGQATDYQFSTGYINSVVETGGSLGRSDMVAGLSFIPKASGAAGATTEAMRITGAGNVGIGTAVPNTGLSVLRSWTTAPASMSLSDSDNSSGAGITFYKNTFGSRMAFMGYDSKLKFWNIQDTDIDFATNDAVRLTIKNDGDVGIGVAAPARRFSVHHPDQSWAVVQITNNGTGVTDTDGFQMQIVGATAYVYNYENGAMNFGTNSLARMSIAASGAVNVVGAFSKGSGSFRIDHPLPALNETHNLVHSFIEGPRADLIYRGIVTMVDGAATVDLDDAAGMTAGTWVLLCRDPQVFTSNATGWSPVRGTVSGSTLTIECEEGTCTDTISWMVVAERQDQHIIDTDWTDEDGRPIIEPLKPPAAAPAPTAPTGITPDPA